MRIVVINAHWSNRGDEAAHRALWGLLRERYPGCTITVLIKDRAPVVEFPLIDGVDQFSCQFEVSILELWCAVLSRGRLGSPLLARAIRAMAGADLIVYPPGGAVISDRFFWRKQLEYLVPFLFARIWNIPLIVAAPSIGPFERHNRRIFRRWLLKTPSAFCVREPLSKAYLGSIGIQNNIHQLVDLAFASEILYDAARTQLFSDKKLTAFLDSDRQTVGVTITDFAWHVELNRVEGLGASVQKQLLKFIKFLTYRGYQVLLIPQLFGNQNDEKYLKTFVVNEYCHVMSDQFDCNVQQYVISRLHSVVGLRYHCNIFAAKMGTPFVAISYEDKMDGFLAGTLLDNFRIPIRNLSAQRLETTFLDLERNYGCVEAFLRANADSWRGRARKLLSFLPDIPRNGTYKV